MCVSSVFFPRRLPTTRFHQNVLSPADRTPFIFRYQDAYAHINDVCCYRNLQVHAPFPAPVFGFLGMPHLRANQELQCALLKPMGRPFFFVFGRGKSAAQSLFQRVTFARPYLRGDAVFAFACVTAPFHIRPLCHCYGLRTRVLQLCTIPIRSNCTAWLG